MTNGRAAAVLAAMCVCAEAPHAYAQAVSSDARMELRVSAGWLGGVSLDSADAGLRTAGGQPFVLFTTERSLGPTPTLSVAAGWALTSRMAVEGGFTWGAPDLRADVSADVEGAAPVTATERITQYIVDGTLVVMLREPRVGRLEPFVSGGGGYLRQLHEGRTLVEQGQVLHGGGGVKYWFTSRDRGAVRTSGFRGDVRVVLLRGGVADGSTARPQAAVSGGFFLGF